MLGSARGRWCNPTGLLTRVSLNDTTDTESVDFCRLKFREKRHFTREKPPLTASDT